MLEAPIFVFFLVITVIFSFFIGFQFFGRYVFTYEIKDIDVELLLFNKLSIGKIPIKDIALVRPYNWTTDIFFSWNRWGNRFFGDPIVIEKKRGLFKNVMLTPDNPEEFMKIITRRIAAEN